MISKLAYVDPSAKIGQNVKIHPFAFIDADVEIGDNCEILPNASIMKGTRMGKNNKVFNGAIIGAEPQDFRWKGEDTYCYIGDFNWIREQVIINRGIAPTGGTRIGNGSFIMAGAHIGHDTHVVGPAVIGNGATVAGNTMIDYGTVLSSNAVVHENVRIGKWALVKGGCRIGSNVPPYIIAAHNPTVYYGINSIIMRKRGFSDEEIESAAKAYRHIYQSQTSVFNALRRVEEDVEEGAIRDEILNFIRDNDLNIVGITIQTED